MNFEQYESEARARYERLAQVVETILKYGLRACDGLGNWPQTQSRAKDCISLKRKLENRGLLQDETIERTIKDLAGCRIIFYTNTDLERFRQSETLQREFDIDWAASKTHFPRSIEDTTADELYQGIHYVVRLTEERTRLPEYADLGGLRCEVQLQTILNHAWSETTHDILYKAETVSGFGASQQEAIREGAARVMKTYLLPAGHELQKIQEDAERLKAGREVFDSAPLEVLRSSSNNNDRMETINRIREHLLPGLDDLSAHTSAIRDSVVCAIEAARSAPLVARESPLGTFAGATAIEVTVAGLEVLDELRYSDPFAALEALIRLWSQAEELAEKTRIEESAGRLTAYNSAIWQRVGPAVQREITEVLDRLGADRRREIRRFVLQLVRLLLQSDISGSERTAVNTITFSRGTVIPSSTLTEIWSGAVSFAIEALDEATTVLEWRAAWNAVWWGVAYDNRGVAGGGLESAQLDLVNQLARYIADNQSRIPYENLQEIEEQFYWAYRRLRRNEDESISQEANTVARSLIAFRDAINNRDEYVRYKTIVGFRTVFVEEWDQRLSVSEKAEERSRRIAAMAGEVSDETKTEWLAIVKQCSQTDPTDMATFPPLVEFLKRVAEGQPATALYFLTSGGPELEPFAPAVLQVLIGTEMREAALGILDEAIDRGRNLVAIARTLYASNEVFDSRIRKVGERAIADHDVEVCIEIARAALRHGTIENALSETVLVPVIDALSEANVGTFWTAHLREDELSKLRSLSPRVAASLLSNLVHSREIDYAAQMKLSNLLAGHKDAIWAMFQQRIVKARQRPWSDRYEAVPEHWHGLEKRLGANVAEVLELVIAWPEEGGADKGRKASLLAGIYSDLDDQLISDIASFVRDRGALVCEVIGDMLDQYEGDERILPICEAMIEVTDTNDEAGLSHVEAAILATGTVIGPFGFAESFERKAEWLRPWLQHANDKIRQFATDMIGHLERRAIEERRSGTQREARRQLEFDASQRS